jgi:hypothetical protein
MGNIAPNSRAAKRTMAKAGGCYRPPRAHRDPFRALAAGSYRESGLNKWFTEIVDLPVFCIVFGP